MTYFSNIRLHRTHFILPSSALHTLFINLESDIQRTVHRDIRSEWSSILLPLASNQQNLYDIYLFLCIRCWTPDDGQRTCPKHVAFYSKNKFEKLVHLVGFIRRINLELQQPYATTATWYQTLYSSITQCRYQHVTWCWILFSDYGALCKADSIIFRGLRADFLKY
jgi:hypothetical protein